MEGEHDGVEERCPKKRRCLHELGNSFLVFIG